LSPFVISLLFLFPFLDPGYFITLEKQDFDLKSHLMIMIEDFKKDISNSLKGIQDNISKQVEALKEET